MENNKQDIVVKEDIMTEEEQVLKYVVDSEGLMIDVMYTNDEDTDTLVSATIPDGMFKPKWTGEEWIEGDTESATMSSRNMDKLNVMLEVHHHLDSVALSEGFTGDETTRPYRAIANYVGYVNAYRAKAEHLGKWIADVFTTVDKLFETTEDTSMLAGEELLSKLPKYTPKKPKLTKTKIK